ncbi:actin-binding protein ipp-like [Stylonychia lemnae]|uniref:Actin-binding protein ipp-like n=1 Tax=Stylonychia lemnae TaxID=5949 RepID=A0A078BBX0_STYLE|nr:actin-binding protein ipp-like [Stylonychia lemnae]|eukprot:CDW91706.1 actin-binding protein ipp-like [Stylonychia lemnae]
MIRFQGTCQKMYNIIIPQVCKFIPDMYEYPKFLAIKSETLAEIYSVGSKNYDWAHIEGEQPFDLYSSKIYDMKNLLFYVVGGRYNNSGQKLITIDARPIVKYNHRVKRLRDLIEPRYYSSVIIYEDHLYMVGGNNSRTHKSVKSCFRYSIKADLWDQIPQLNITNTEAGLAVLKGYLYAFGGSRFSRLQIESKRIERLHLGEMLKWEKLDIYLIQSMINACVAQTSDKKCIIFGGRGKGFSSQVKLFDHDIPRIKNVKTEAVTLKQEFILSNQTIISKKFIRYDDPVEYKHKKNTTIFYFMSFEKKFGEYNIAKNTWQISDWR